MECSCLHSVSLYTSPAPPSAFNFHYITCYVSSPCVSTLSYSGVSTAETQSRKGMGWGGRFTPRRITMFGIETQAGKSQ